MKKVLALLLVTLLAAAPAFAARKTAVLEVSNMTCRACPITVRKALERVPGVASAKVDYETKQAVVVFDTGKATVDALTKATGDAGYPSVVKQVQ